MDADGHGAREARIQGDVMGEGRVLDYLRLMRLPNVFTAIADILMGFALVHGSFSPLAHLLALCASSAALYTAGMVLNDYFDVEVDRRERPERPLPSGRIPLARARTLGFGLLAAGTLLAPLASLAAGAELFVMVRTLAVAGLLAATIVAYDGLLKHTRLGPWTMGACRLLNVWLGMTADMSGSWVAWQADGACVAGGLGLYIVGVTWFSRQEAETSRRGGLVLGLLLMIGGWCLLAALPHVADRRLSLGYPLFWYALLLMLAIPVLRRTLIAIAEPSPWHVQVAIKHCIMTVIFLDAAVVLQVGGELPALVVLALLAPMLLLGRWVYST